MRGPPETAGATVRPATRVAGLRRYERAAQPRPIDLFLDANEGVAPPMEELGVAAASADTRVQRYPSAAALERELATTLGIDAPRVLVTAGGDDALERICRATLEPGTEAVLTRPTFEMIGRYVHLAGGAVVDTPWIEGPFPTDAVIACIGDRTRAIFVVTPNNPTGGVATSADLQRLSEAAGEAPLVVDLAYTEYADEDLTAAALALPNTVIVRTFSKAWGLAGLRVGYAAGSPEIIGWLRDVGQPYAASGLSLEIARRWARTGRTHVDVGVARVRRERTLLTETLAALGAKPISTQANFVLARFPDAGWVADALAGLGIAVRGYASGDLRGCLRITCPGDDAGFSRLTAGLRAAMRPEAILFDLDGVIADVSRSYRRAIVQTAAAFGVAVTGADIAAVKAAGDANNDWIVTRRVLADRGVPVELPAVVAEFERLYQGGEGRPGLREEETLLLDSDWLAALRSRYRLGMVTGRPRSDAAWFLERFGLAEAFDTVVCMEDAPRKPDPAPIRLALDRLGVAAAWMIGDTPDDLVAARRAGVVPIGCVAPGDDPTLAARSLTAAGAARVLGSVNELKGMLQ